MYQQSEKKHLLYNNIKLWIQLVTSNQLILLRIRVKKLITKAWELLNFSSYKIFSSHYLYNDQKLSLSTLSWTSLK